MGISCGADGTFDVLTRAITPSSDAIVSLDVEGHVVNWNAGAERIFGYSVAEAVGQHISIVARPDDVDAKKSDLAALLEGCQVVAEETVWVAKDGRQIDISLSAFPLCDAAGNVSGCGAIFRDITERKQSENALRESQQRFATIFNLSPTGIGISRASDGVIIDANRRLLEMFGFEREDVVGRCMYDLDVWLDPSLRAAVIERIRDEGAIYDMEVRWRTNSKRLIDTTTSWETLDLGGETCVVTIIHDTTARKEAEEEREQLFRLSSDLIAVAGFDGRFRSANPTAQKTVGYAEGELVGVPILDLVHPEDRENAAAAFGRLIAGDSAVTFEGRVCAKDGSHRWVELAAAGDHPRQLAYIVGRDMTGRREMEGALRASEERFRSVVETAEDAIIVIDSHGVIEAFNRSAETIFGYSANEAIGRNVSILMPSPHHEAHDSYIARFLATGERRLTRNRQLIGLRKDGVEFPMEFTVSEVRTAGELRFTGIVRDISKQKQLESELLQAKEDAEDANRAKSVFLSRMSHELRTPLNIILGFGQLLKLDPLEPPQTEAIEHILAAGHHLLELIGEVLDISGIEAGRLSLSIEPMRVEEFLTEMLGLIRPLADEHGITINSTFDSRAEFILADRKRLKQVLLNLLSNAIKYNRERGSVTVSCLSASDSALRIMVTDSGPGIPPEKLVRLFSPFDRLGAEATGVEGTGLGLALSRHIIEAMGGAIGVESAVDTGSTFWIEIPLDAPANGPETKTEAAEQAESNRNRRERSILYVDDNVANLKLIERILTRQKGVRLLAARQGSLGIALARDHQPRLILLDLHLPDMLGSDVLRELKTHPTTIDIPVVVISADTSADQADRLLEAGARACLTKPLDVKAFLDLTNSILNEAS